MQKLSFINLIHFNTGATASSGGDDRSARTMEGPSSADMRLLPEEWRIVPLFFGLDWGLEVRVPA